MSYNLSLTKNKKAVQFPIIIILNLHLRLLSFSFETHLCIKHYYYTGYNTITNGVMLNLYSYRGKDYKFQDD